MLTREPKQPGGSVSSCFLLHHRQSCFSHARLLIAFAKISITEEFKPLYPYSGQFNLSVPSYSTDHDQCRAGRPQPRPPLPHSRPSPPPPPPSSQRLAFLEVISESFRPSKTQSISLSDFTDQTDKVLWLINEMVTRFRVLILGQETKMQHKFDPTSPTHSNYRYH